MRVGFYKDTLGKPVRDYWVGYPCIIEEVAKDFADLNHQINEPSDENFTVYVEDENLVVHEVSLCTEYCPNFSVVSTKELGN